MSLLRYEHPREEKKAQERGPAGMKGRSQLWYFWGRETTFVTALLVRVFTRGQPLLHYRSSASIYSLVPLSNAGACYFAYLAFQSLKEINASTPISPVHLSHLPQFPPFSKDRKHTELSELPGCLNGALKHVSVNEIYHQNNTLRYFETRSSPLHAPVTWDVLLRG